MDPVTAVMLGTTAISLFTQFMGYKDAQGGYDTETQGTAQINRGAAAVTQEQVKQIGYEQDLENNRRQFMEMDARRRQLENLRNFQRARATALENATTQGASYGSGLQGGYSQIRGESEWNALGVNQQLYLGRNAFDINALLSQSKIAQAYASLTMQQGQLKVEEGKQQVARASGESALGGSIMQAASPFARLVGGPQPNQGYYPTGTPRSSANAIY